MCVIAFAWDHSPQFGLALIGNRDEFYARPACAAARWGDRPHIVAGRDLQEGGSWLAVSPGRGAAAVTNVREGMPQPRPLSRGSLPVRFLDEPESFLSQQSADFSDYRPFNFIGFAPGQATYLSNAKETEAKVLEPGLHHLSNGTLNAPWPKSLMLREALDAWLGAGRFDDVEPLFAALGSTRCAPDAELPDTGIGIERERALGSPFIRTPEYGTRTSSILLLDRAFRGVLIERQFDHGERHGSDNQVEIG
ncbi:NRDE family protein [Erythrobacter mangrovi]|uniref:NRDE family protein n=1 Tax=Erythrobacter mangrovi TaxID=2739433 RepID=A0A7D3Y0Q8_9SPHN|nr:NRDE family protein [Erythrobacter mangrovi]QKG72032.1 NRDE family protein [Erythrobacter mangrovi]